MRHRTGSNKEENVLLKNSYPAFNISKKNQNFSLLCCVYDHTMTNIEVHVFAYYDRIFVHALTYEIYWLLYDCFYYTYAGTH